MNAVLLYTRQIDEATSFEFNVFDNQFATENLAVRKVLMSMMEAVHERLDRLLVEYNDSMLAEKLGARRAAEILRSLGGTQENMRENQENGIVISRFFETEFTEEKYAFFYNMTDIAQLPHYRMKEGEADRVVFYYSRYLQLIAPDEKSAEKFLARLSDFSLPYKLVPIP
ncbi:hypothetical protein ACAF76_005555 [Brevibacillus sp. TJ4]|uniref:hypothetical protein n=1 Tax=Brevibacillus sp. TJ4 TaxID=3234853 RepID=UPI003BA38292